MVCTFSFRFDCLTLILQWRGATLQDGEIERVDMEALDEVLFGVILLAE